MTNTKFLMMLSAGAALLPSVGQETASAAPKGATIVVRAPIQNKARVGGTPMPRLTRDDSSQPGNEKSFVWFAPKATTGLYFAATTELNTGTEAAPVIVKANRRVQGSMTPVSLKLQPDGSVAAVADFSKATFITNLNGNEYRQFHNAQVTNVNIGGQNIAWVEFNYRPNNNTERYAKAFTIDASGAAVELSINGKIGPTQAQQIYSQNNDDCSANGDSGGTTTAFAAGSAANVVMRYGYEACNGNGRDDDWLSAGRLTLTGPNALKYERVGDVSVNPRAERGHGFVHLMSANFAVVAYTEGDNQPCRDGTWVKGIDLTKLTTNDARAAIIWSQQVGGRIDEAGVRTYAMRMKSDVIPGTNQLLMQWDDIKGNNTQNYKGGTPYRSKVALATVDPTGLKFTIKPTDTAQLKGAMDGVDVTHINSIVGMFGDAAKPVPAMAFLVGNHFGGGAKSDVRVVSFDSASGLFKNAGTMGAAPFDRHLYANYLGNNPGQQGKNKSYMSIIDNPFLGQPNVTATKLLLIASTAKDTGGAGGSTTSQEMKPEIKLAGWLTVLPIQANQVTNPPPGTDPVPGTDTPPSDDPNAQGDSLGGCNAGGSAGFATFLLLGLAAFIRRRR